MIEQPECADSNKKAEFLPLVLHKQENTQGRKHRENKQLRTKTVLVRTSRHRKLGKENKQNCKRNTSTRFISARNKT